jgi:hypothetical protein
MGFKEKWIAFKTKTVNFVKEHKTEIICIGAFAGCFAIAVAANRSSEKDNGSIPVWDNDALGLKEGDVSNSLEESDEEYDWDEGNRITNWELAKEFASRISLEDGEMYMFYNGESGDGQYVDNGINGTIIEHLDGCGNAVYPETVDDHEWECKYDVMEEINSQNARILNFANTIDFAENTSYTIEKNEDGKTQVVYKQWLSV